MAPARRSAAGNGAAVMEGISTGEVRKDFSDVLDAGATRLLAAVKDVVVAASGERGGSRAYLVGGLVRDGLLGRRTTDVDIAVPDGMASARSLADRLGGHFVPLDAVNGVGRVIVEAAEFGEGRWQLDFSTAEGGIEQDLARRDFTMNAIAVDLEQLVAAGRRVDLIDPFDGRGDLARGLVRAVSDGVFESDPIRLLRAVRFAAELGLGIDDATDKLIRAGAGLIVGVASERIREELLRLLAVAGSGRCLARLDELGLLTALIPELEAARGFEQPKEHQWDVLGHSLKTAEACDFLLRQGDWEYATGGVLDAVPWSPRLEEHFRREISGASPGGSSASALLRLAAVLHDIAKPETRTVDANGRTRFLGHQLTGATTAVAIVERLRFSVRETRMVETIVREHHRPTQLSQSGPPSSRAIYRYLRDTGGAAVETLFLSLADHLATRGPTLDLDDWRGHAADVELVLAGYFEETSQPRPVKLVDGHDLMRVFGIAPGPRLGEMLEAVREAQAAGEITTPEEALDLVRRKLPAEESDA